MKKTLKKLLTGFLVLTSFFVSACATPADSPEDQTDTGGIQWNDTDEELVTTKGIATNITLSIGGGENSVWAKVKNNFTLLPSTIWVYVELYSSESYQESYTTMKLEKMDSVKDLDIGKSITISAPTGGMQKYWQARMRYKFDDRDWVAKTTSTFLYSAEGAVMDQHEEEIKQPTVQGPFYSLQQAYDKGWLTQKELLSIAYYHHSEEFSPDYSTKYNTELMGENYQPIPKTPENLSEDTKLSIKQSLQDFLYTQTSKNINLDNIDICAYYGTYNDVVAIRLRPSIIRPGLDPFTVLAAETVAGVRFNYFNVNSTSFSDTDYTIDDQIKICKITNNTEPPKEEIKEPVSKGPFYTLSEAYNNGFLTQENLQSIANYHSNNNLQQPELSEDIAEAIKREWVKNYKEQHSTTDEISATIQQYYGTYNDCVAIIIERTGTHYITVVEPINIEVGGVTFTYGNSTLPRIVIFKLGKNDATENPKKPVAHGLFYSLQQAYDNGLLTQENLQSIADYHNNGKVCHDTLDDATVQLIKESAAYYERNKEKSPVLYAKTEDYEILKYYGTYNDCYAVVLNTPYSDHLCVIVDEWVTIGGVKIHYTDFSDILIWKLNGEIEKPVVKGPFYSLQQAYDYGWLTQEELLSIAYYHHSESYTYDLNTEYNTELMGENYQPIAKSPEALSEDTKLNIKQSLRDLVYTDTSKLINLDNIHIVAYYGTYNDGYAIRLAYSENDYGFPAHDAISDPTIGGVKFFYPSIYSFFWGDDYYIGYTILYWKPINK